MTGQYASVDENLTAPREPLALRPAARAVARSRRARPPRSCSAGSACEDAGDKQIAQFSGGMRRRLDLAASLISRPPLIFLDEPTTGLDPRTRGQMWDTIRELVRRRLHRAAHDAVPRRGRPARRPDRGHRPRPQGRRGHARRAQGQVGNSTLQLRLLDPRADRARPPTSSRRVLGEEPVLTPEAGGINVAARRRQPRRRRADRRCASTSSLITSATVQKPTLDEVFMALTGHAAEDARPEPEMEPRPMTTALTPHGRRDRHRRHPRRLRDLPSGRPCARRSAEPRHGLARAPRRCAATRSSSST